MELPGKAPLELSAVSLRCNHDGGENRPSVLPSFHVASLGLGLSDLDGPYQSSLHSSLQRFFAPISRLVITMMTLFFGGREEDGGRNGNDYVSQFACTAPFAFHRVPFSLILAYFQHEHEVMKNAA